MSIAETKSARAALADLPRRGPEAMGPCALCDRQLLATEIPLFYRVTVEQCGIDGEVVRKHVGLAMTMGGGESGLALASVLGPKVEPVVVMNKGEPVNICNSCSATTSLMQIASLMLETEE